MENKKELEQVKKEISNVEGWALSVRVETKEDFMEVQETIKQIKGVRTRWENYWKPIKEMAYNTWKQITMKEKEGLNIIDKAINIAKQKAFDWYQEEERKRLELERKLQAEAEEKARREKEKLLQKAEKTKTEEKKEELIQEAEMITPPVVSVPSQIKMDGVSVRKTWYAELEDMKALVKSASEGNDVALSLLLFDQTKANQLARATKGAVKVAGVKFVEKEDFVYKKGE